MLDYKGQMDELIATVIKEGASDLHLSSGRNPTIRVSGNLIPLVNYPKLTPVDTKGLLFSLLAKENQERFTEQKELDFSYAAGSQARFRGNAFLQQGQVGVALRLIPTDISTIEQLNLPPVLADIARKEQGFFLVVGPVGHGKSTTLAAMVNLINQERAEHIVTIEDPIEYVFPEGRSIIDQREVRFDTNDFHTALRSMFREDVNVGMIGEMREPETIATAVTAAETGHLIFSTLHTNNAAQTVDRIIDSFPSEQQKQIRLQLASSLLGIFSQRLVARVSGGRIPAYELLLNNSAVSNLIREGRTHEINVVIETGTEDGMVDMNHSLSELVRRGEVSPDTAYRYSLNPEGLQRLL
ncbi:MAG TPA: type IV pilus twitching motility protein PilT [Candidatus Paceibacterota bacterium]